MGKHAIKIAQYKSNNDKKWKPNRQANNKNKNKDHATPRLTTPRDNVTAATNKQNGTGRKRKKKRKANNKEKIK